MSERATQKTFSKHTTPAAMFYKQCSTSNVLQAMFYKQCSTSNVLQAEDPLLRFLKDSTPFQDQLLFSMIYFLKIGCLIWSINLKMILHLVAYILISWLLSISWLDPAKPQYATWAAVVVLIWWLAWRYRNPPWPLLSYLRPLVYALMFALTFPLVVFVGSFRAYLVSLEILFLYGLELYLKRRSQVG